MIKKQDRDQYFSLVNSLVVTVLKEDLEEAKESNNNYNSHELRNRIVDLTDLALDIIDVANDKFNKSLENAGEFDTGNEAADESAKYYAEYDRTHK